MKNALFFCTFTAKIECLDYRKFDQIVILFWRSSEWFISNDMIFYIKISLLLSVVYNKIQNDKVFDLSFVFLNIALKNHSPHGCWKEIKMIRLYVCSLDKCTDDSNFLSKLFSKKNSNTVVSIAEVNKLSLHWNRSN